MDAACRAWQGKSHADGELNSTARARAWAWAWARCARRYYRYPQTPRPCTSAYLTNGQHHPCCKEGQQEKRVLSDKQSDRPKAIESGGFPVILLWNMNAISLRRCRSCFLKADPKRWGRCGPRLSRSAPRTSVEGFGLWLAHGKFGSNITELIRKQK